MAKPPDPFQPGQCERCSKPATVVINGHRLCSDHGAEEAAKR